MVETTHWHVRLSMMVHLVAIKASFVAEVVLLTEEMTHISLTIKKTLKTGIGKVYPRQHPG